jgi:hypothetical protein
MDDIQVRNRTFEGLAWGAFFIWWGITELYPSLPSGAWVLGFGVIMLALNAARSANGLPTSGFTITVGVLALLWGGLEMAGVFLNLPYELPVFAIVLIVLGVILLARTLAGQATRKQEA